jgi:hypothetical protein
VLIGVLLSLTVIVKFVAARGDVGVPVILPFVVLNDNPLGKPELMAKLNVPMPPLAVTGVNAATGSFSMRVLEAIASVVLKGTASICRLNVFEPLCPALSFTVIVYVTGLDTVVGVPLILPVLEFMVSPVGKLGVMVYVSGATPPLPVTGINGVAAEF